jgi:hypothetical protein
MTWSIRKSNRTRKIIDLHRGDRGTVSVEVAGKVYHGSYEVTETMITVALEGRTKTTQLGASPAEGLARIMLRELVEDRSQRGLA